MTYENYLESAAYLHGALDGFRPETLIILGSGVGGAADSIEGAAVVAYEDIPHFRRSTAHGHLGRLIAGTLGGRRVLAMQGRFHTYEGYTPEETAYPVRVAKLLGCENMIATNAAGGINTSFSVGDLMLITDFIRLYGQSSLSGPNIPEFGARFPDMTHVFDTGFLKTARDAARDAGIELREGVYFFASGPQYETPAEIRAMRTLGADAVGMSTVYESITAAHAGMRVLGISVITNMAAGVLDQPLTSEEVMREGARASERLTRILAGVLKRME